MPEYDILTCSTADMPAAAYREHGIIVLPYPFFVNGKEYTQDPFSPFDSHAFYESMREGALPTTSNLNQMAIGSAVQQCFEKGRDVLYIVFSSRLSSTFQVAESTRQAMLEQYPERKLILVDSRSASCGQWILARIASRLRSQGMPIEQAAEQIVQLCDHVQHFITVSDLDHLFRGGRISRAAAMVGRLASVKPILTIDRPGHLVQLEKVNGRRKSIRTLVEHLVESGPDIQTFDTLYILHGDCLEDAEKLREKALEAAAYPKAEVHSLGPVIGSHTGPDMLALVFLAKSKRSN